MNDDIKKKYYGTKRCISNSILKEVETSVFNAIKMYSSGYGNKEEFTFNENFELGDALEELYFYDKQPKYVEQLPAPQDYAVVKATIKYLMDTEYANFIKGGYSLDRIINDNMTEQDFKSLMEYILKFLGYWKSVKNENTFKKKLVNLHWIYNNISRNKKFIHVKYRNYFEYILGLPASAKLPLLSNKLLFNNKDIILLNDVSIIINGKKILIDMLAYDSLDNSIYLMDIKSTINPVNKFKYDFIKYKYYLQAAFYKSVFTEYVKNARLENTTIKIAGKSILNTITTIEIPNDARILDFRFVVLQKQNGISPVVFRVSKKLDSIGKFGGHDEYGNKIYGILELETKFKNAMRTANYNSIEYSSLESRADNDLNVFNMFTSNEIVETDNNTDEEVISDEQF